MVLADGWWMAFGGFSLAQAQCGKVCVGQSSEVWNDCVYQTRSGND